jgi:hypothetical protein
VLALEGMALESLGRPADALEAYRQVVARGGATPEIEKRLAALSSGPASGEPAVIRR